MWDARLWILVFLPLGAVRPAWGQPDEIGPRAQAVCDSVAAWLRNVPVAEVERIEPEALYDRTADRTRRGCALVVSGDWREVPNAPDPLELVERADGWFGARGWREDPTFIADGAGSGSRGFVRDGLLCVRSAVWGGDWEDEDLLDHYDIRIGCVDRER